MRSIKTLHINTEEGWRGGEAQVLSLMEGIRQRNHEALLVAQPGSAIGERARQSGFPVREVPMKGEFDLLAVSRLAGIMKEERIEVCHFHTSHAIFIGSLASRWAGTPVTVLSRRVDFPLKGNPLRRIKYQWGIDKVIAISRGVERVLVDGGIAPEKIVVIPSGVNIFPPKPEISRTEIRRQFGLDDFDLVVGNIAHLTDHKGHRYLLEAIPKVLEVVPRARFLIVGKGELEQELKEQSQRLGIASKVHFAGFRKEVISFLAAFDLFVMPSHLEGLGTSILDAMVAGLPVVGTRTGGIPEIIEEGETGLVVPPKEPIPLAQALVSLLNNEERRKGMGRRAREEVRRYSKERMAEKTVSLYEELLEKKESRGSSRATPKTLSI